MSSSVKRFQFHKLRSSLASLDGLPSASRTAAPALPPCKRCRSVRTLLCSSVRFRNYSSEICLLLLAGFVLCCSIVLADTKPPTSSSSPRKTLGADPTDMPWLGALFWHLRICEQYGALNLSSIFRFICYSSATQRVKIGTSGLACVEVVLPVFWRVVLLYCHLFLL